MQRIGLVFCLSASLHFVIPLEITAIDLFFLQTGLVSF